MSDSGSELNPFENGGTEMSAFICKQQRGPWLFQKSFTRCFQRFSGNRQVSAVPMALSLPAELP